MSKSRSTQSSCPCLPVTCNDQERPTPPIQYNQHELWECFPCFYRPLEYLVIERFPCVQWMKKYNFKWLLADIIAGLTVGLMVVPQALAYAEIADLPHRYGLYSAFMGCFVYFFFGTSKDLTIGPTAILSLLTASLSASCSSSDDREGRVPCAVALTLLCGIVQTVVGVLNLGFLVDFIPVPVISGFTSAAALTIAIGQFKNLMGISDVRRPVYLAIYDIFANITETKPWDLVLGICCIALVVFLKYFKKHIETLQKLNKNKIQQICLKFLWFICTARNAVVVLIAGLIGLSLRAQQRSFHGQITLISYQHSALPPFCPPFDLCSDLHINVSSASVEPGKLFPELGIGIVVAPMIAFLEAIAIAKAFARQGNYKLQPTQELIALGLSNVASSFVGSYPVTGSFSRTAVNAQSGVRTPAAGIFTGAVVLLAVAVLSSAFKNIPKAALAAIIIAAVLPTVDIPILWKIKRVKFVDLLPLAVSFFLTIFVGIQYGVPVAVVVYVFYLLYRHARPRHEVKISGSVVCVEFNGGWDYPGVDYILKRVFTEITATEEDLERQRTTAVVFECSAMPEIDYTIVQAIKDLCDELHLKQIRVIFVNSQPQVMEILKRAKIASLEFFPSLQTALQATSGTYSNTEVSCDPSENEVIGILASKKNQS